MAIHNADVRCTEGRRSIDDMREQRPAGEWLQYFGQIGAHARSLSCR